MVTEVRGNAAASWLKGTKHKFYEDRYRLLPRVVSLVEKARRGELYGVFDGIGSAPKGMEAAQQMCDLLPDFFRKSELYSPDSKGMEALLLDGNQIVNGWGSMSERNAPLGGCAGTVAWIWEDKVTILHAGDTAAVRIRDGVVQELTRPHQTPDGAIFRYFGLGQNLKIDVTTYPLEEGDWILLLSDGVTKVIHPMEVTKFLGDSGEIGRSVENLVRHSRSLKSSDDITAVLVEIDEFWF